VCVAFRTTHVPPFTQGLGLQDSILVLLAVSGIFAKATSFFLDSASIYYTQDK